MKLAQNKNVTYGTRMPPGETLSGKRGRRMVSRKQCPPMAVLSTLYYVCNFFVALRNYFKRKRKKLIVSLEMLVAIPGAGTHTLKKHSTLLVELIN